MPLKSEFLRDSGVQTDFDNESILDYKSDLPILKHSKHVQFYGTDTNNKETVGLKTSESKTFSTFSKWTIEPFMFLFMFSFTIGKSCIMNLMLDKACLIHLNFSSQICGNLSNHIDEKDQVEKLATVYSQYSMLISMGIGAVTMTFLGPWSDKYGRKPPVILSAIGFLLNDIGVIMNAVYFDARLEYLLLPPLASGFTGGIICIMSTAFSLASEMTTEKQRTIKYAFLEMSFGIGMTFGPLTGGLLYDSYSYVTVFSVATVGHVLTLLWGLCCIPETRGLEASKNVEWTEKFVELFSFKNLSEGFKAFIKPRPNYTRLQLWLLLMSICLIVVTYESFANIAYVYVFHMYSWGPAQYATVNTIFGALGLVVIVGSMPMFIRVFKVRDPTIGLIGSISMAAKNLCFAFATYTWIYYLGSALGLLSGAGILAVRSHISKIVENDELGKVFSFLATSESLVPLVGTIAMTNIFNDSLDFFPGLIYLITTFLLAVPMLSFAWMVSLKLPKTVSHGKEDSEAGGEPIVI